MNDEIKEILNRLDFNEWEVDLYKVPITWSELYTIRDYITNLQQENERLKKLDENYPIEEELAEAYRREENYKSRIDKAIDKLYCWGEVLNADFQKGMLDILKENK